MSINIMGAGRGMSRREIQAKSMQQMNRQADALTLIKILETNKVDYNMLDAETREGLLSLIRSAKETKTPSIEFPQMVIAALQDFNNSLNEEDIMNLES